MSVSSTIPIQEQQGQTGHDQKHYQVEPPFLPPLLCLSQLRIRPIQIGHRLDRLVVEQLDRLGLGGQVGNECRLQLRDFQERFLGSEDGVEGGIHGFEERVVFAGELLDLLFRERDGVIVVVAGARPAGIQVDRRCFRGRWSGKRCRRDGQLDRFPISSNPSPRQDVPQPPAYEFLIYHPSQTLPPLLSNLASFFLHLSDYIRKRQERVIQRPEDGSVMCREDRGSLLRCNPRR